MFGRQFGQFYDWTLIKKQTNNASIENRIFECKQLFDETIEKAISNITKAQEKQVKKQNAQSNVSHDCLKQGEIVYVKNCKLVTEKMEPKYYGPYEIIRQNKSGNYILKDPEGNELEQSFPRWKLNPLTNFKDIKAITNKQCDSDSSESDSESTSDDSNTEETNKMATELIKSKETNDQPHKSEEKKKSNIKIDNRIVYKFEESIEKH